MPSAYDSELAKKLNLKSGTTVRAVAAPAGIDLSALPIVDSADADGLLVFVHNSAEVQERGPIVVEAARAGRITWMAYPKAKQLGTDLNRDILWQAMKKHGIAANRQISLDETWSAMRFKVATPPR